MKSSDELLSYVEKTEFKTRYGSDGSGTLDDITYCLSLGENAVKTHCLLWLNDANKYDEECVEYQKAIKEIYEFLIGE